MVATFTISKKKTVSEFERVGGEIGTIQISSMIHLTFICFRCVLTVLYCILKRNFYVIFLFRDIGATGGGRRKEFVVKIHGNLESVL